MDAADLTTARDEAFEPFLIANSRKPEGPKPTGSCHYCGDQLEDHGARFCNKDCAENWQRLYDAGKL